MRIVVLTGMSGSGKSTAIHALEDAGYYAIDNLPIKLIDKLVELLSSTLGEIEKVALVVDARAAQLPRVGGAETASSELELLPRSLELIRQSGHEVELVFLDATDDVLERRYSETRRRHPLAPESTVQEGILVERKLLEPLMHAATRVLDTSTLSVHELRKQIQSLFSSAGETPLSVTVLSFGFKHGAPTEADLVFDVRFLPNPHFVPELRPYTGEHEGVARYVLDRDDTRAFLGHLEALLAFLLPRYEEEGKAYLTIAVGCTGGRHRSVAVAREVAAWLERQGRKVQVRHRDVGR